MFRNTCTRTAVLLALLAACADPARAQDYPAKLARILVPFPAGGSTDVIARMVGQKLGEVYGQNFVIDNRPGATGTIAGAMAAKSAPDGYTLIMHSSSSYVVLDRKPCDFCKYAIGINGAASDFRVFSTQLQPFSRFPL